MELSPQPQTWPVVSMASAVSYGITSAGIEAIFTPGGKSTFTALVSESASWPLPSSPSPPRPQAYTVPLVSRAYSPELELPTCATMPGSVIGTGRAAVPALVNLSSKNVPQRSTTDVVFVVVTRDEDEGRPLAGLVA